MFKITYIGLIIIGFLIFIYLFVEVIYPTIEDARCIKMEMKRATNQREYDHWRKKLRKTYFKRVPFVKRFMK